MGDYAGMNNFFSAIDWTQSFESKGINGMWEIFKQHVVAAIHTFVPFSSGKPPNGPKVTARTRKAQRFRNKRYSKYKRFRTDANKHALDEAAREVRRSCRQDTIDSESAMITQDGNPNWPEFFKTVNTRKASKNSTPVLISTDGEKCLSSDSKAQALSDQFSSVFTTDDGRLPPFHSRTHAKLDSVLICEEKVQRALKKLPNKHSKGDDGIPPILLKHCAASLAKPLCLLFQKSFDSGGLPEDWAKATVVPIFKRKGSSSSPKNYRPVSLTSTCCKTFETLLKNRLLTFLHENHLISKAQHGFLSQKSTLTNSLTCLNQWFQASDRNQVVHSVLLDFAKAFDTVSHPKLLHKLRSYGIQGNFLRWLAAFLDNRTQRIRVDGVLSPAAPVTSGVPQGSVLGPVLFLIFINDLPEVIDADCFSALFADDAKIFTFCDRTEVSNDTLQSSLQHCADWAADWQMTLAAEKCEFFKFGRTTANPQYSIGDIPLPTVNTITDLGVKVSSSTKPSEHCDYIYRKASRLCSYIFRAFRCRHHGFLVNMFKIYVLPVVMYNSPAWSPFLKKDIILVERVLRNFTRRFPGLRELTYSQRLKRLDLLSLEEQRLRVDLIYTYRIIHNLIDLNFDEFFQYSKAPTRTNGYKLYKTYFRLDSSKGFFSNRVIDPWNDLPIDIVNSPTLNIFKAGLKNVDLSRFLKGDL